MNSSQQTDNDEQKKLHWSMVTCFWTALIIVVIAATSVIVFMHKAVWVELETLAAVIGILMTLFYSYILYHGVKFLDGETIALTRAIGNPFDFADGGGDLFGHFTAAGASEGIAGLLLGLLLDIIVCLVLAFLLSILFWLGVNLVVAGVVVVAIPLFYIFKRSLSFVLRHVDECKGDFWKSCRYGFGYAILKTATLCLMIFASHELANIIKVSVLGV